MSRAGVRTALAAALGALSVLAVLGLFAPRGAFADRPKLDVSVQPVLGPNTLLPMGFGEVAVRIASHGDTIAGEVRVAVEQLWGSAAPGPATHVPFALAAHDEVLVHVPVRLSELEDVMARVLDEDGEVLFQRGVARSTGNEVELVVVDRSMALGSQLRGAAVASRRWPWARSGGPGYATTPGGSADIAAPQFDPATGDPVLPDYAVGYARAAAVLLGTEELVHLGPTALAALGTYVLGGGTLALVPSRPEDLRSEVVALLVGGEVRKLPAAPETLRTLEIDTSAGATGRLLPNVWLPEPALLPELASYAGGNLRPSLYGASAAYGLGEVHLLGFDPLHRPGLDSGWVHNRILDLLRRALERRASVLFPPGDLEIPPRDVRRLLDPNESSRWGIVIATLVLCAYAILAGPVNFGRWRKKGKPLAALPSLALIAAGCFAAVVVVGFAAKGCVGRARSLSIVEAGAGMKQGTLRRYRAYFAASSGYATVWPSSPAGILALSGENEGGAELRVDGAGLRLEKVPLEPWETVLVREDGLASLGDGVALVPSEAGGGVRVVNRTGHTLRGLVLHAPASAARAGLDLGYLAELGDGDSAESASFTVVGSLSPVGGALTMYGPSTHVFEGPVESRSPGLGKAWSALASMVGDADWFPADVPALLAELVDGDARTEDGGFRLEQRRQLVRVLGWGGEP
ncbi:MAG: hypothetical protein HY908_34900 [Myxococcales bacterium]|nr:hypothetical protein [Myxococcales bacterium]